MFGTSIPLPPCPEWEPRFGCPRQQVELDVVGQGHDLADLNTLFRVQLISGDSRPAADIGNCNTDAEVSQGLLQLDSGILIHLLGASRQGFSLL